MVKLLLFGYGNPGRGDDALGPELIARVAKMQLAEVECQNDMQLQVEHVTDLDGCGRVLFVDADMSCAEPFEFYQIAAGKDDSYTSHAMSPSAPETTTARRPPIRIASLTFAIAVETNAARS